MRKFQLMSFFVLAISIFSIIVSAQDLNQKKEKVAVLKGKIMRSDTKEPVSNVKILLIDENKSEKQDNSVQTETDKTGGFLFNELKAGKYTISIRAYFDNEEDVPCRLLLGKIDEPNSQLLILTEKNQKIEQIFIKGFSVKAGKEINKEFDLVCKSLFGK